MGLTAARRFGSRSDWLLLPPVVVFALVFGVPMVSFLVSAFLSQGEPTMRHVVDYLKDPYNLRVLGNTLRVAAVTTVAALVLGVPFAVGMRNAGARAQRWLLFAVVIPFTASVIVKCLGWQILFRSNGPVNQLLIAIGAIDAPIRLLLTETALVVGAVSIMLPFIIIPVFATLCAQPPEIEQAAATLGAGLLHRFFKVTLPLAMPGVVAGSALVFAQTAAAYVIPTMLSGERLPLVSKQIVNAVGVLDNLALGAVASIVLLAVVACVLLLADRIGRYVSDPARDRG